MDQSVVHFTTVFTAFFAIMNPVANAPLFVGVTDGLDDDTRRRVALHAVLLAFAIVGTFAAAGGWIFHLFGISLPAFRIAGGLLIGLVGYHMLQGEHSSVHTPSAEDNRASQDAALDIAITPLAIPILAGPGTIATAMSYSIDAGVPGILRVLVAFALMCAITWASFVGGRALTGFLGQNGIKVISRLMGLILAVVGVQMLLEGIRGATQAS